MNCVHCRTFFIGLHRRCTIHLNGECDCPICQGLCDCKVAVVQLQPTASMVEAYSAVSRKFGERKK